MALKLTASSLGLLLTPVPGNSLEKATLFLETEAVVPLQQFAHRQVRVTPASAPAFQSRRSRRLMEAGKDQTRATERRLSIWQEPVPASHTPVSASP